MNWSPLQDRALVSVRAWWTASDRRRYPFFYLAGFAGSGKTTLARQIAEDVGDGVMFGAFTGKAASVLRAKGCRDATTIHRMIYVPCGKDTSRLFKLRAELDAAKGLDPVDHEAVAILEHDIRLEEKQHRQMGFAVNEDPPAKGAKLLILDECSMIPESMAEDLLSLEVPILVLGDPAQLPPVKGTGYFTEQKPDFLLDEIHRQAWDNPVLRMATKVRQGEQLEVGEYGTSAVISSAPDAASVATHDQIICGRNDRRRAVNARMRELAGFEGALPVEGDKLVCLRNNKNSGVFNGEIWWAEWVGKRDESAKGQVDETIEILIRPDSSSDGKGEVAVNAFVTPFLGGDVPIYYRAADAFDFGYCLTAHKAQGSEWPSVLIFDESRVFRQDARRWLYTALTRASERVTVVRS